MEELEKQIEVLKDTLSDREQIITELKKECEEKDEEIARLKDLINEALNLSSEIKHILS